MERCLACEAVVSRGTSAAVLHFVQRSILESVALQPDQKCNRSKCLAHRRPCSPRPRKRGSAPRVATPSASQARQRSMGGNPFGLASEAALHGWRPLRPRKRGNAPRVATPSASQARQRSTRGDPSASQARQRSMGGDRFGLASEAALHGWRPLRPCKRGSAPRVATPSASQARQRSTGGDPSALQARQRSTSPGNIEALRHLKPVDPHAYH
jgi:hypothetical protein